MGDFFAVIHVPKGKVMPIVDENDNVVMFDTLEDAIEVVAGHPPAEAFGYDIFQKGKGEQS